MLVLVQEYPKDRNYAGLTFVHPRLLGYKKEGVEPVVISFKEKDHYFYEGILICSEKFFNKNYKIDDFDLINSHAPNIRNHLRFLVKSKIPSEKIVFTFHGQEVLNRFTIYPKPFWYSYKNIIKKYFLFSWFDPIKLFITKAFLFSIFKKSSFIFVSQWMKKMFESSLGVSLEGGNKKWIVIHNPVNDIFYQQKYISPLNKKIVTLRPWDDSKYGIDIVLKIAKENPDWEFHLYGKGTFFKFFKPTENIHLHNRFFHTKEIPEILNQYQYALMPTRLDSQGVMACEMAVYGIPLITSSLPICKEMLEEFKNVGFIDNDNPVSEIKNFQLTPSLNKSAKFKDAALCEQELNFFKQIKVR